MAHRHAEMKKYTLELRYVKDARGKMIAIPTGKCSKCHKHRQISEVRLFPDGDPDCHPPPPPRTHPKNKKMPRAKITEIVEEKEAEKEKPVVKVDSVIGNET